MLEIIVTLAIAFMVVGAVAALGNYLTGDPYKEMKEKIDNFKTGKDDE